MASDVTHMSKNSDEQTWQKNQEDHSNIQNSLQRFENIPFLFEIVWNFIGALGVFDLIYLLEETSFKASKLAFQR